MLFRELIAVLLRITRNLQIYYVGRKQFLVYFHKVGLYNLYSLCVLLFDSAGMYLRSRCLAVGQNINSFDHGIPVGQGVS